MKLIITVLLNFTKMLINLVLLPLNLSIMSIFPGLTDVLDDVNGYILWLKDFTAWVISWLPFDTTFYTFVVACLIAVFSIPLITSGIKLVVKWWHYLVP